MPCGFATQAMAGILQRTLLIRGSVRMNQLLSLYRQRGSVPDKYWYQMNGKSAHENWVEQRANMYEQILVQQEEAQNDNDNWIPSFSFSSEVKLK